MLSRQLKNATILTVPILGGALGSGSIFLFNVLAAFILPQSEYGAFLAGMAHVNLGLSIAAFGLSGYCARTFAENPERFVASGSSILKYCGITVLCAAVFELFFAITAADGPIRTIIVTLAPMVLGYLGAELGAAISQIRRRYALLAFWLASSGLLRLFLLGLTGVLLGWSLSATTLAIITSASSVLVFSFAIKEMIAMARKTSFWDRGSFLAPTSVREIFKNATPFGAANAIYLFYSQAPIIFLSHNNELPTVGSYGLAMTMIATAYLFPSLFIQRVKIIPIIEMINCDPTKAQKTLLLFTLKFALAGAAAAGAMFALIEILSQFIFDEKYQELPKIAAILLISLPFKFAEAVIGGFLIAKNGIYFKLAGITTTLAVQFILLFFISDFYGVYSVAAIFVFTEALLVLLYYIFFYRGVISVDA